MIIRKILAAVCVAVGALTMVGCSEGVSAFQPVPTPVSLSLSQAWDQDGCLVDLAYQDGAFVAGRQTNLCRELNTEDPRGNFYFLYTRGTNPQTDWHQLFGVVDGYAEWMYPDTSNWFRMPVGGDSLEIQVTVPNGGTTFTNFMFWEVEPANEAESLRIRAIETQRQGAIRNSEAGIHLWTEMGTIDARVVEIKFDERQRYLDHQQAQLELVSKETDGANRSEANLIVQELHVRMAQLWSTPECTWTRDGCSL